MEDVISHVSNSRQSSFTDMAQALEGGSIPTDPDRKVALITGITGQDGSYLAEFLLEKGYQVISWTSFASKFTFKKAWTVLKIEPELLFLDMSWYVHGSLRLEFSWNKNGAARPGEGEINLLSEQKMRELFA